MSLSPAVIVTLGPLRYDVHVAEVTARLAGLPGVNACRVVLPAAVQIEAAPGDEASLALNGGESGQDPVTVISGKVRLVRRRLLHTEAVVADGSADLAALRPAATYERQAGRDVIRALAQEAGVSIAGLDLDLPLAAYVAHQGRTAAEHIAGLARLAGALATFDGDGGLGVRPLPGSSPDLALLYGREVLAYDVSDGPGLQTRRVMVGNGPAGSADAPDALLQSPDVLPGDATRPGRDALWTAMPVLRTPAAALAASQAAEKLAAAAGSRVHARCFLLPQLRPGAVVEVQELPGGLSGGPWLVTHVRHHVSPLAGGLTVWDGISAGAGAGTDLPGAVGSLL